MKLLIACIGRAGRGPERDLYEHYAGRIRWPLALRELEEKRKLPPPQMILREGELLHIPSWIEHQAEALEDTFELDVFAPIRQDWLNGTDDYLRR